MSRHPYRWHLGCIPLNLAARSSPTGILEHDCNIGYHDCALQLKSVDGVEIPNLMALAEKLAASRLVACAQVSGASIAVKTTAKAKADVEALMPGVQWTPIEGNKPYLDWLDEETREAAEKACEAT